MTDKQIPNERRQYEYKSVFTNTDKQIIINGVDVSGCEFLIINNDKRLCRCIKSDLFGGIEFVENAKNGNCKDNPNCYYKQLKRKEQECEELKKNVEHWKMEHKEAKAKGEWTYDLVKKRLGQQLDQLKAENEKLEQTLTEIKEIAQYDVYTSRTDLCLKLNWIKKKISECEVRE